MHRKESLYWNSEKDGITRILFCMNSKSFKFHFWIDLSVAINVCFNVTYFFNEIFRNTMLKGIDTSSRFQIIKKT